MSFLSDPNFALTLAFCALFALFGRLFKKHFLTGLDAHRARVIEPIAQVEALLKEAEKQHEAAQKNHALQEQKIKEILELAQAEAQDILEHAELRRKEETRAQEHLFAKQATFLHHHWEEQCLHVMIASLEDTILHTVKKSSKEAQKTASFPFLAHHLQTSLDNDTLSGSLG